MSDFLSKADYWLVSQALTLGYVVVTHEVSRPESKASIKIPDACQAVGLRWASPFTMLRTEGARFRL